MTFVPTATATSLPTGGAASQVVGYGGSSGTGAWVFPPGFEIGYDQVTGNVNITGTASATPTTLVASSAYMFDGAAVIAEFFAPGIFTDTGAGGHNINIGIYESGALVAKLGNVQTPAAAQLGVPVCVKLRFTPTAAVHTYTVAAWTSATTGTPVAVCGAGTGGAFTPMYTRFTKV